MRTSQLTPFGQSSRSVLLEEIAAVQVAVMVKMIVYRGVSGSKLLQRLDVPEPSHRALTMEVTFPAHGFPRSLATRSCYSCDQVTVTVQVVRDGRIGG